MHTTHSYTTLYAETQKSAVSDAMPYKAAQTVTEYIHACLEQL